MALRKTKTARRREVARNMAPVRYPWLAHLRRADLAWAALWLAMIVVIGGTLVHWGRAEGKYHAGETVRRAVVARVAFEEVDAAETAKRREDAYNRTPAIYTLNERYLTQIREKLRNLIQLAGQVEADAFDQIPEATRQRWDLTPEGFRDLHRFVEAGEPTEQWSKLVDRFITDGLMTLALLPPDRAREERDPRQRASKIQIVHPEYGMLPRGDSLIVSVNDNLKATLLERASDFPASIRPSLIQPIMEDPQAFYVLDEARTTANREAARAAEAVVEIEYPRNTVLIEPGTQLTPLHLQLIDKEQKVYLESLGASKFWARHLSAYGVMLLVGVGLLAYVGACKRRILENPTRGLSVTVLTISALALAVFSTVGLGQQFLYAAAVLPVLLTALIFAIAYDQRFALGLSAILSLAVMVALDLPVEFMFVMLAGLAVAVGQLAEVRTRSKLVMTGLWSGLAMGVAVFAVGFLMRRLNLEGEVNRLTWDAVAALLTGGGAGLIAQGVLPLIERGFRVTTSMTLKDLNDASHPLLRRLAEAAPGTYQHSLRIADMSESAADAIGANGLLCRVGAMYHDIGKMNKPLYFVENQGGGPNRHAKLSPAMSLLIIVGHVKDGIEMAREASLPANLRHFIESHHGTTLVEYFYHAAKKQREGKDEPTEFEFRYPGPKPQTREAAILMLCDSIEGASRTLDEPNPARLEQLVQTIAKKRLMDGQFDDCSLTLQELHRIENAITRTLCAIYHGRVKYPSQRKDGDKPGQDTETPEPQPAATA